MRSRMGSSSFRTSSGSRSAKSSIEPLRSAKSTVTCLQLPFESGLRCEDLLGEMLGRVAFGRRKAWLRTGGNLLVKLGSTAVAKSTARRIDVATGGARELEACPAAVAEAGLGGVVLLAPRAAHQVSPLNSASACSR